MRPCVSTAVGVWPGVATGQFYVEPKAVLWTTTGPVASIVFAIIPPAMIFGKTCASDPTFAAGPIASVVVASIWTCGNRNGSVTLMGHSNCRTTTRYRWSLPGVIPSEARNLETPLLGPQISRTARNDSTARNLVLVPGSDDVCQIVYDDKQLHVFGQLEDRKIWVTCCLRWSSPPTQEMVKAPEVKGLAAQSMRYESLNLSNTASKDCFAAEFIVNPVKGTIKVFLLMEEFVGK